MLRTARGVMRSLRIYYSNRQHASSMDRLYRQFVSPGDIVFDVGAHVGDRTAAFRRLGARIIAIEPQPALSFMLKVLYGRCGDIVVEPKAVGSTEGTLRMMINIDNPTVSTASSDFIQAAQGAAGWEDQVWNKTIEVQVTTLDALIRKYGLPAFIKIDVEGLGRRANPERAAHPHSA